MSIYVENPYWYYEEEYIYNDESGEGNILIPLDRTQKYPVLYLLHGAGGIQEWQREGITMNLNQWMNNNNLRPMVVVMPSIKNPDGSVQNIQSDSYYNYIRKNFSNLVNFISKEYADNVLIEPSNTVISGLSMGGAGALYVAVLYKDIFMHVGALSSGQELYIEEGEGWIPNGKNLILNSDKSAIQFIVYSKNEPHDFRVYSDRYIEVFENNGFNISTFVGETEGHCYNPTFNFELELFLKKLNGIPLN